ncbi:Protein GrpE [Porphyridium purpureum]|uniref:GrpE protein homolog n=1 Tax=Porphyridium purpureum TaxID=35688 RepID=A0A5J4YPT3_PORPP|nr:Protein GrpE [Porphyridium purpureum]|eukprot:POR5414..scf296_7
MTGRAVSALLLRVGAQRRALWLRSEIASRCEASARDGFGLTRGSAQGWVRALGSACSQYQGRLGASRWMCSAPNSEKKSEGDEAASEARGESNAHAAEAKADPEPNAQQAPATGNGGAPHVDVDVEGVASANHEADMRVATLEARVKTLEKEVVEHRDRRLRALAELQNLQRISQRDVTNAKEFGISKFAMQLLDVADNLERALSSLDLDAANKQSSENADASESTPADGDDQSAASVDTPEGELADHPPKLRGLYDGVAATHRELMKVLSMNGIEKYGAKGDVFDPNLHNALFQAPHPDHKDGAALITAVLKTGYTIKSRVLRAADVGVSCAAS